MGDVRVAITNISKAREKGLKGVRAVLTNILLTELIGFILSFARYRSTQGCLGSDPASARSPLEHKERAVLVALFICLLFTFYHETVQALVFKVDRS